MISIESPRRRAGLILTVALVLLAVSAGATPPASAQAACTAFGSGRAALFTQDGE